MGNPERTGAQYHPLSAGAPEVSEVASPPKAGECCLATMVTAAGILCRNDDRVIRRCFRRAAGRRLELDDLHRGFCFLRRPCDKIDNLTFHSTLVFAGDHAAIEQEIATV